MAYTLTDIFKHEDKTRQYCFSEGGVELSVPELIKLAGKEKEFNSDYAEYLIFKRLHLISSYIAKKANINVKDNKRLKKDIENNNLNKPRYEEWLEFYKREAFNDYPDIYDIIDQTIIDKNWNVLYYLYYKEENELYDLVAKEKNKLNERKFFIIQ